MARYLQRVFTMATESLQLNLGTLRSAMSLTLHTHHASRIWHGRAPLPALWGLVCLRFSYGDSP